MAGKAGFWDRNAEKYFASPISDEDVYEEKLRRTRSYFTPDSEVLEIGCGTGGTAISHAPFVKHVRAVDISENMLDIGRRQAAEAGVSNVTFEQGDFDAPESGDGPYDVVLALSILHLLRDRRIAMSKIRERLKPGGVFISSTACLGDRMWFMAPVLWLGRLFGRIPFVRIFTVRQMVKSVEESGFVIEDEWLPEKAMAVFIVARKPE